MFEDSVSDAEMSNLLTAY